MAEIREDALQAAILDVVHVFLGGEREFWGLGFHVPTCGYVGWGFGNIKTGEPGKART